MADAPRDEPPREGLFSFLSRRRFLKASLVAGGAVLGVGTGLLYGWGAVTALPDTITSSLSIPSQRLLLLIAASAASGLFAAMLPARRAGRMNVLDAITGR